MPDFEENNPLLLQVLSGRDIFKHISSLALPMAASYTFSLEMWLLVFFLSRLNQDKEHEASIALITNMINSLVVTGISPILAMSIVSGRHIGELKNEENKGEDGAILQLKKEEIASTNYHGLAIAGVMTPTIVLPLVFSNFILADIFKQDLAVAKITQDFTRPYALAIPGLMLRICSEQTMCGFGKTKPAMFMGLANFSIGMGLTAALGLGKLGAPKLNETGILIGYIAEAYLTAIAYSAYIAAHPFFKNYPFFRPRNLRVNLPAFKKLLQLGGGILAGNIVEMLSMLVLGIFAGRIGVLEQSAFASTMQIVLFTFLLQAAFGLACCQEMSRQIGEKLYINASRIGRYSIPTTLVFVMPLPIILSIVPKLLTDVLGQDDQDVQEILPKLIPIMATSIALDAARFGLLQQLRTLGDGNKATLVSSAGLVTGTFLSWCLGFRTNLGIYGVALGFVLGVLIATLGLFMRWQSRIKPAEIESYQNSITNARQQTSYLLSDFSFFASSAMFSEQAEQKSALNPQLL